MTAEPSPQSETAALASPAVLQPPALPSGLSTAESPPSAAAPPRPSRLRLGIAGRLALVLALVGLCAAGLTGFYAYQASRSLQVVSARNELLTSTQVLARRITQTREEITRNLQVLVNHPATLTVLQHGDAADAERLASLFGGVMTANPSYLQLRLISASEHGLERVRMDRRGASPVRVLGDALQEKGHYAYVAETLQMPAGATYLSRITINHESGTAAGYDQPALQQAMPVIDAAGKAIGVVVVNVDLNSMFALLAADLPEAFTLYLANGGGDVLIHPDSSKTFGFDRGRRVLLQDEFAATAPVVNGHSEHVVFDVDGDAQPGGPPQAGLVAAFVALPLESPANENRLVLGLAQPLAQVLAQSQPLGQAITRIVLGLGLVSLLVAAALAQALTRPINAVSEAARRFAAGEAPGDLPLRRNDEIGSLARRFQQMQVQITRQLADLKTKQQELEHLSHHDMLTGLPNRRLFQDRLAHALAQARRNGEAVCLLFIDLNDFKQVNDQHGHDAGDVVLQVIAQRLHAAMRQADTVARLGGDEFVVLLDTSAHPLHVALIAEKLLDEIRLPVPHGARQLRVDASIGIARYPHDGETASDIMANADRAMYATKTAGEGGYRFFSVPLE
ncbi:MAG TPA: diguanylate cyclase [Ideonella sp.]|uniref:diguanylate cyclase domain-containing protein n=1 Tax=Ideonella sp. TaxID=1929293 RepID=UPI002C150373|nr:diguanylate cyclase [Ideonella sp.]HSI52046.1 diguanylate cyclase [Ideonella sp.]